MKEVTEGALQSASPLMAAQRAVDVITSLYESTGSGYRETIRNVNRALKRYGEEGAITGENFDEVKGVTRKLYKAVTTSETKETVSLLNSMLVALAPSPHLSQHDGNGWRLQLGDSNQTLWVEQFATSSALAFAALLVEKGRNPCGVCASSSCTRLFIDLGKGGGRNYCSPRCATRERVATYRKRMA